MQPKLKFDGQNELVIDYVEQTVAPSLKSDQGPACTNTIEAVYLISVIFSIVAGIGNVPEKISTTVTREYGSTILYGPYINGQTLSFRV